MSTVGVAGKRYFLASRAFPQQNSLQPTLKLYSSRAVWAWRTALRITAGLRTAFSPQASPTLPLHPAQAQPGWRTAEPAHDAVHIERAELLLRPLGRRLGRRLCNCGCRTFGRRLLSRSPRCLQ
eukprot:3140796-Prymnesium_polylepis.1